MVIRDTNSWQTAFEFAGEAKVLGLTTELLLFEGKDHFNEWQLGVINFTNNVGL
jgi:hypothetical protein